ncbi:MAG: GNAT family N-acetyltransferase [Boseongicola sp. SB0677_bin_26]|nr:GNAT family N-acetyltransferase [Boseongicola sp. SB0665_bin_10]MYG25106.1 GNAT family N-acetyltransferase [Boseongicola sp. SB0677_bin_26]
MIRRAETRDMPAVLDIRARVFIKEQGVSEADERDGRDDEAIHLIAFDCGKPVGTARLLIDGHAGRIGRVAVLAEKRGRGLGKDIMRAAVDELGRQGVVRASLGSQAHAVGFYEALGFEATGPEYFDAGIPHREMVLSL